MTNILFCPTEGIIPPDPPQNFFIYDKGILSPPRAVIDLICILVSAQPCTQIIG